MEGTGKEAPPQRRELQGPRPTPLKVRKDSHKIKKPPLVPLDPQQQQQQQQPRPPVIIYTVSPKVIHTQPSEFMSLVQRLTGPSSAAPPSPQIPENWHGGGGEGLSPAARLAVTEKTRLLEGKKKTADAGGAGSSYVGIDMESGGCFPGILSPCPELLPPVPAGLFSPAIDTNNPLGFLPELSPAFLSSPTFLSYHMNSSATPSPDLFNFFFDL